MPYMACSPASTGGSTGRKPQPGQLVQDEPVQRQLGHGHVADPVGEPGAGQPGAPLHVDPAALGTEFGRVAGGEAERRPLANLAQDLRVLLGHAVGGGGVGQVRDAGEQRVPLVVGMRQVGLGPVQLGGEPLQLGELPGPWRTGPGGPLLLRAQRLGALGQLAPPGVRGEQCVEVGRGPAPVQRGPVAIRFLPGSLEIYHRRNPSRARQAGRPVEAAAQAGQGQAAAGPAQAGPVQVAAVADRTWLPAPSRTGSARTRPRSPG